MDTLTFNLEITQPREAYQFYEVVIELFVNGESLSPFALAALDIVELYYSARAAGSYFIWTCGCGSAECGGIHWGVRVAHDSAVVTWQAVTLPFQYSRAGFLTFDKAAYQTTTRQLVESCLAYLRGYQAAGMHIEFVSCPHAIERKLSECLC
jgi:hypothetical protein